jgi:hypothetical protein
MQQTIGNYVFLAVGVILAMFVALARSYTGGNFVIRWEELVLLVLPVILWLLASGQLESFKIGSGGLQVKTALQRAALAKIELQISQIPVELPSVVSKKEGLGKLPSILASRPQALAFTLHHENWYDELAVKQYVSQLSALEGFKYFLFYGADQEHAFLGAISAANLARHLLRDENPRRQPARRRAANPTIDLSEFIEVLNSKKPPDRLKTLSGFVGPDEAVNKTDDKKSVLSRMDEQSLSWLPVVDKKTNKFAGIVEQSRLAASLILDVTKSLDESSRGRRART